jgi:Ca-activated chloride channel homolog
MASGGNLKNSTTSELLTPAAKTSTMLPQAWRRRRSVLEWRQVLEMKIHQRTSVVPDSLYVFLRGVLSAALALGLTSSLAHAQIPFLNAGPDSSFANMDLVQTFLDSANKDLQKRRDYKEQRQKMVDSGTVSVLDLDAPNKAIQEFDLGTKLLRSQNSKEAIVHLQKAVADYPKFVLAYNALGMAYEDANDPRAKEQFETAAKLDDKFPGSFMNLGNLALMANDFSTARSNLEKAASISPKDPKILQALAFAQNGDHQYKEAVETAEHLHALDHKGMANVHYVAAAAALALNDSDTMARELNTFLSEDPTNPFAPVARKNLDILDRRKHAPAQGTTVTMQSTGPAKLQTFPNSDRLKSQLNSVGDESSAPATTPSNAASAEPETVSNNVASISTIPLSELGLTATLYTIHHSVDETALFFAVSSHGHMINDLDLSDIHVVDDNRAPQKIEQFIPQSKLPLRVGLLVDTSGSVQERFAFEKRAAAKFLESVINGTSDLGFVAGFATEPIVTQDFVAVPAKLGAGVQKLSNGGGTALFDAVTFACWKLQAYPDVGRVAKVLVILSDGEDNSSHHSLKQAIEEAEASGVTIYTVSTSENPTAKNDADKILQVLAERSGGEAMFPGDMPTLGKDLDRLRELIRSRYLLAYKAADFQPNGKYRTVHVTAEKDGKKLQVHVRKGYYARVSTPNN